MHAKISTISLLFVFTLFSGLAEEYTFTNKSDERKLTATVVGIAAGKVSVKKDDNIIQIPVANLVDEDITFLKDWLERNPNYAIRFTVKNKKGTPEQTGALRLKNRNDSTSNTGSLYNRSSNRSVKTSVESEYYELGIINDSNIELEGASIKYRVYIQTNKSKGFGKSSSKVTFESGTIIVPTIGVGKSTQVSTREIRLENTASASSKTSAYTTVNEYGNYTTEYHKRLRKDRVRPDVKGIWFRIYKDGMMIREVQKLEDSLKNEVLLWDYLEK